MVYSGFFLSVCEICRYPRDENWLHWQESSNGDNLTADIFYHFSWMFLKDFYLPIYLFFLQTLEQLCQKEVVELPKIRNNQPVTTSLFIALSCPCYLSQFYCCSPPNFLLLASLPCPVTRFHFSAIQNFFLVSIITIEFASHLSLIGQPLLLKVKDATIQSWFVPDISFCACLSKQGFISVPILCQEKYRLSEAVALRSLVSMEPIFTPP